MPALAPLVFNDGQATPVAQTFSPVSNKNDVAKYINRHSNGEPHLDQVLTISQKLQGNGAYRTTLKFVLPVTHAAVGEPTFTSPEFAHEEAIIELTVRTPQTSTGNTRADALAYISNILGLADVQAVFEDLESMY